MIMDRLFDSARQKGVVCLGLDTAPDYVPRHVLDENAGDAAEAVFAFNKAVIDATLDVTACYKVQIAYYEALGLAGLKTYARTLRYIKERGGISIADIKRGDIKDTAAMYARAHFSGDFEADMITLNPYMGLDSLEPYAPYFQNGKGCFVLVRTSNPGAKDIEYLETAGGARVYEAVAQKIAEYGRPFIGGRGYSAVGAVMGCTNTEEIARIRGGLPTVFFLIPGYGAQGGRAEDVALYLNGGNGGVVNSSRAILLAYRKHEDGERRFAEYARAEAADMNAQIMEAVRRREDGI